MYLCSWKHTARDYFVQSGSQKYLIYQRPTTFVSGRSDLGSYFQRIFLLYIGLANMFESMGVYFLY